MKMQAAARSWGKQKGSERHRKRERLPGKALFWCHAQAHVLIRPFDDPISLRRGREFVTLENAVVERPRIQRPHRVAEVLPNVRTKTPRGFSKGDL
jgi:hypothetical protein